MSSCPLWRPDCQIPAAVDAASGTWHATTAIVSGTTAAVKGAGAALHATTSALSASPKVGGLLLLVAITWLFLKLFAFGRDTAAGALDVYTGGSVSRAEAASPRRTNRSKRSGGGSGHRPSMPTSKRGRQVGRTAATSHRSRRGPQPTFHTGRATEMIERQDGQTGAPKVLTVCSANPGDAAGMVGARFGGRPWRPAGIKRCDLNKAHKHYRFTKG